MFESRFLLRGVTCEPELSVSAHHHSRHRLRIGDIWRQDKGSPALSLRIGLPEPLPKLDVVAVGVADLSP
jgi:hypothetical protein